jgi:hypothetical protein
VKVGAAWIAASAVTVLAIGPREARAAECTPAQVAVDPASLPPRWRDALLALVAATGREGQPWSCPANARIAVRPPHDGALAQLEVDDGAGVHRRPVASPADVVPLGEAMLTRAAIPEPENPPPPPPPPAPGAPPFVADLVPPPLPRATSSGNRLLVDVLLGARYTGATRAVLIGPELRATLESGRWHGSLVARYDEAIAICQQVPPQFTLSSVTIGFAGGYKLLASPVEIVAAIEPTLAVVFMGAQRPMETEPDVDAHVDLRLGARLAFAFPLLGRLSRWRGVAAIGGEGVPAALFSDRSARRFALPEIPSYLAGLSVGVELEAIR